MPSWSWPRRGPRVLEFFPDARLKEQLTKPTREVHSLPAGLILAGGLGTRLRSAYATGPKSLAPVGGKPFLDYLLTSLASSGMRDVILCVGYKAEQIKEYARSGEEWGLHVSYSVEEKLLGTGGALKKADELISGEEVFAMNGDTYLEVDLAAMLAFHRERRALVTIAAVRVRDAERYGTVEVDEGGHLVAFHEKRTKDWAICGSLTQLINGGFYVLSRECLARIPADCEISLEKEVLPDLIASGRVFGFVTDGYFLDIGVENDYNRAQTELIERFSDSYPH
jgi:D-glycero-alpha-D-manno-heptose 1-phosphate guanylyltransferase